MCFVSKVGKVEQTGEIIQDNTQSAPLLKRSGNIVIGASRVANEATGLDRVINAMTHPDPKQGSTLEAVLKTSLYTDPKLDEPETRELIIELFQKPLTLKKLKGWDSLLKINEL